VVNHYIIACDCASKRNETKRNETKRNEMKQNGNAVVFSQDRQADHERNDTDRTGLRQVVGIRHRELRSYVARRKHTASLARPTQRDFRQHREDLRVSQPTLPQGTGETRELSVASGRIFFKTRKYTLQI